MDTDGRCTLVNPAASAILGFAPEDVLGRNMHDLVHHHYADGAPFPEANCPLFQAFRDGRSARVPDTVLWRRDGTAVPVDCTSSPLLIDGAVAGAVVTFRDVTSQRRTAEAMQLLADAGEMLASSLEHEVTVSGAVRMALPLLGEACVVYLQEKAVGQGSICRHIDPSQEERLCELLGDPATALGSPADGDVGAIEPAPGFFVDLGMASVLTAALRGRQGRIGTLITKTLVVAGEGGLFTLPDGRRGAMLRAYDKGTGREVGAVYMPAPQSGSPMTYLHQGRQYIVVAISTPPNVPGELIAFRLPEE